MVDALGTKDRVDNARAERRECDRQTQERIDKMQASLRRCSFLLNSARLVMADKESRDLAGEAVAEANSVLRMGGRRG